MNEETSLGRMELINMNIHYLSDVCVAFYSFSQSIYESLNHQRSQFIIENMFLCLSFINMYSKQNNHSKDLFQKCFLKYNDTTCHTNSKSFLNSILNSFDI